MLLKSLILLILYVVQQIDNTAQSINFTQTYLLKLLLF